jgi:hypothetical protein
VRFVVLVDEDYGKLTSSTTSANFEEVADGDSYNHDGFDVKRSIVYVEYSSSDVILLVLLVKLGWKVLKRKRAR